MIRERYTQVRCDKNAYTRGFTIYQVMHMYTHMFSEGKMRTYWEYKFWSVVFSLWYLVHGIWSKLLTLRIGSKVLVLRGFGPWY